MTCAYLTHKRLIERTPYGTVRAAALCGSRHSIDELTDDPYAVSCLTCYRLEEHYRLMGNSRPYKRKMKRRLKDG